MTTSVGFATHGDTLKLLFAAFGMLPRKEALGDGMEEKDKKTLQKLLSRLSSEEGSLVESYKKAIASFVQLLAKYLPTEGHVDALIAMLQELDRMYGEMIREEGTYLGRHDSVRYFISVKAIPAFVMTLNRIILRFGPDEVKGIGATDAFWYLPTWEPSGRLTMPLEKVLRWTYASCDTSQKQFHCPGKLSDPVEPARQQNLENAINWTRGKTLPSVPALLINFTESFSALSEFGRPVKGELQKTILTTMVYARVGTFVAELIRNTYDEAFLKEVCLQIQQTTALLQDEVQEFRKEVMPAVVRQNSKQRADVVWFVACEDHERFVLDKLEQVRHVLLQLRNDHGAYEPVSPETLDVLRNKYGNFAVHFHADRLSRWQKFTPPPGLYKLVDIGMNLKSEPDITLAQIDAFEEQVVESKLEDTLCWFPPWLRGVYNYRREDFAAAFPHYETAFERAKYRAGQHQYKLVNQFVELAAKNDKAIPFKKGVEWATYIGLQIRWLRDKEATQENLDFTRYIMKRANYAHQL